MILLRTRHCLEFNPTSSPLDPDLCPYADSYDDYTIKRKALGQLVGTDDFIWCIPKERQFAKYEMIKPVEWIIQVNEDRVRGYVHDQNWFDYLEGRKASHEEVYFTDYPPEAEYSVLVDYPLREDDIIEMKIFQIIDPNHAGILCQRHFSQNSAIK